jgi:hypothetical protein
MDKIQIIIWNWGQKKGFIWGSEIRLITRDWFENVLWFISQRSKESSDKNSWLYQSLPNNHIIG